MEAKTRSIESQPPSTRMADSKLLHPPGRSKITWKDYVSVRTVGSKIIKSSNTAYDETDVITNILHRDRGVYLDLRDDNYLEKTAGELDEGDRVLWNVDSVDSKLTYLADEDYRSAKDRLFTYFGGREIPVFQYELLMAAVKKGFIEQGTLEDKLSTGTLSSSDLKDAVDYIHREYNDSWEDDSFNLAFSMDRTSIQTWIRGKTLSPQKLEIFFGLGKSLDHKPFMEIYTDGLLDPRNVNLFWGAKNHYAQTNKNVGRINTYLGLDLERVLSVESSGGMSSYDKRQLRDRIESDTYVKIKGAGTHIQEFLPMG